MLMDVMIDEEINAVLIQEQYEKDFRLCNQGFWRMRDGHIISIKSMSSKHLINTIAMINRNLPKYEENYLDLALAARTQMEAELHKRYPSFDPAEGFFDEV